jgi:hypothetical protein
MRSSSPIDAYHTHLLLAAICSALRLKQTFPQAVAADFLYDLLFTLVNTLHIKIIRKI